ncbi:MAG: ATP-binding protein [Alphaproteobacteria bacterium]
MISTKHTKTTPYWVRLFWLAFAVSVMCILYCSYAFARDGAILVLDKPEQDYILVPYSYFTKDPDRMLSPDTLMRRHKSNLRGARTNGDIISLSDADAPLWLVFTVFNKSHVDDWILDFGDALEGRMGMIKKINILNHSTKQIFTFPPNSYQKRQGTKLDNPFVGAALPLDIRAGTKNTFVIQLEAQQGLPLIFSPKLMPQHTYMRQIITGDIGHVIVAVLFIAIGVFFISFFYAFKDKSALALASYYTVLCAVFFNFSLSIIPSSVINGSVLFCLYMSSYLLLIIATRYFCSLKYHRDPLENFALISLGGLLILGSFLYLGLLGTSVIGLFVMSGLIGLCVLTLLIILFFANDRPLMSTLIFGIGLLLPFLAFLVLIMTSIGVLAPYSRFIVSFWLLHLLQAMVFIAAYVHAALYKQKEDLRLAEERQRDEQAVARLQKSKESADQARLIRVIERERELMAELREREVRRTEEMRIAKDSADKANQAKSAFLAVVSHEIRTPMNGILGMVQLLQKTPLNKSQYDYVETIRKSGDTMMALLNDILDFEKIERGSMVLEVLNFDLRRMVEDIVILMSGHAAQKGVSLHCDIDTACVPNVVSGDPTRLRQVLLNLVNNAIKFTEEGSVTIQVSRIQSDEANDAVNNINNTIRFCVRDTGIGISKEGLQKLFTPFTQTESSTTRKYGGTGLGLAISYRIIEAMGSQIRVDSVEGQGSTFFFDLDMIIQNQEGEEDPDAQSVNHAVDEQVRKARPMRILVTEDNELNRKVIEGLLAHQGHTLLMATNGLEALKICEEQRPDLILMDIKMDGLNGLETTCRLRAHDNPEIANIPVIAITGNVMLDDIQQFFAAGMNGFLPKPVESRKLEEVIYNASIGKFENAMPSGHVTQSAPTHTSLSQGGLTDLDTGLSLEDQEFSISETQVPISLSKNTEQPLNNIDTSTLKLTDDDPKEEQARGIIKENDDTPMPHYVADEDEVTEIDRFLMEHSPELKAAQTPSLEEKQQIDKPILQDSTPPASALVTDSISSNPLANEKEPPEIAEAIEDTTADDAPDSPAPVPESTSSDNSYSAEDLLDIDIITQLLSALGKDQFCSLLKGFQEKALDIIEAIEILQDADTLPTLGSRAHELKGLAGNFGMKLLSAEAGKIEKAARTSQKDDALRTAQGLRSINTQTRSAFERWTRENIS